MLYIYSKNKIIKIIFIVCTLFSFSFYNEFLITVQADTNQKQDALSISSDLANAFSSAKYKITNLPYVDDIQKQKARSQIDQIQADQSNKINTASNTQDMQKAVLEEKKI
ncbi:hypothetical protein LNP00_06420 [Fructobacillus sp. M158]|uniref:hypothetical protein n=1 Tax=Fructobacillus parabroussonetiae TaxID=2713174 RepID=UPI00200AE171|nr:hypothetical protein [Fructobacillus parabroussonetiae]MCK8617986.1 hypothetical protein [Fructobacillus parabroussonetiae]